MKTFRPYDPDQRLLLPPSLEDWVPENHVARFVSDLVDTLDLSAIEAAYTEERGYCHQDAYYPPVQDAYFPPSSSKARSARRGSCRSRRVRLA